MNVVRHYVHTIRPHYDAVIAAVEGHARFWRNKRKWTDLDGNEIIHSLVRNLSLLKTTPCVNTDDKHERI